MAAAALTTAREDFLCIRLLTERQLSNEFCVDRVTLWRWRREGMPYVSLGTRTVRYSLLDVLEWLTDRKTAPRAEAGEGRGQPPGPGNPAAAARGPRAASPFHGERSEPLLD